MAAIVYALQQRRQIRRESVFRDRQNPLDTLIHTDIIARYRFPRHVILHIVETIAAKITLPTLKGGHVIPAHVQVLVTLRFLAKGDFLSEVADIHGVSRSSCSRIIGKVCTAIGNHFSIRYPMEQQRQLKHEFYEIAGMPNCVGAIDGTLIPIQSPAGPDGQTYVCRKGFHAINVQAVCDANMRFLNAVVRWPGATHDAFVLANSAIAERLEREQVGWVLGDSGYPLKTWLLTPYLRPAAPHEFAYNLAHARTRNVVERAFGLLKARFRCLHSSGGVLPVQPPKAVKIIHACFCLHNLALQQNVPAPDMLGVVLEDNAGPAAAMEVNRPAQELRNRIARRFN